MYDDVTEMKKTMLGLPRKKLSIEIVKYNGKLFCHCNMNELPPNVML